MSAILLGPLVMLAILVFIGLFIFLIVRVGKDRPVIVGCIVGGFVLLFFAGIFFFALVPHDQIPAGPLGLAPPAAPRPMTRVAVLPFVLLGLLVAALIAFVKGGRPVRITLGIVLGVALLLLPLIGIFTLRVSRQEQVRHQAQNVSEPAIWHEGVVEQHAADVYPSRRSAARVLGMRVAAALDEVLAGRRDKIRIRFVPDAANPGLIEVVAEGYGSVGGTWTVGSSPNRDGDDEVTVDVQVVNMQSVPAPWRANRSPQGVDNTLIDPTGGDQLHSGTLQAGIQIKNGTTMVTAEFTEKPWVENIAAFLTRDPMRQFALCRSNRVSTSAEEARAQAAQAACSTVAGLVRRVQKQPLLKGEMGVVEADLTSGGLIVDRFTQRLSGSMTGSIWREAVLVDVSDEKIRSLAEQKTAAVRQDRTTWAKMGLTLAGMFALISAVYVFLNAATKGYYVWALRVAVIVLMGAGVYFLLLLA
ncbi:MAG: hypothetical protein IH624_03425 [Phycisphaerae bacterium]|nr:hypothetical protein [Phycisphaerae bacterium]